MLIFPVCNKVNALTWLLFYGCRNLPDFYHPPAIPTLPAYQRLACLPVCVCSPTRPRVCAGVLPVCEVQPDADRPPRRATHEQSTKKPKGCQLANLRNRKPFDPAGCRPPAGRAGGQVA